jgi:hypothetical protein
MNRLVTGVAFESQSAEDPLYPRFPARQQASAVVDGYLTMAMQARVPLLWPEAAECLPSGIVRNHRNLSVADSEVQRPVFSQLSRRR